jgi:hypothetical protein
MHDNGRRLLPRPVIQEVKTPVSCSGSSRVAAQSPSSMLQHLGWRGGPFISETG